MVLAAVLAAVLIWPGGEVAYRFDRSVGPGEREAFRTALALWQPDSLGLRFREVPDSPWSALVWTLGFDRTVAVRIDRNLPAFGRTTLGAEVRPELVFNPGRSGPGWLESDLAHEWGHVLGLLHEHQRRDRDRFVEFPEGFWKALAPGRAVDYRLNPGDPPEGEDRPYDWDSLMHYSSNVDGNRMVRRDTGALIPGAQGPSAGDRARLAALYPGRAPQEVP